MIHRLIPTSTTTTTIEKALVTTSTILQRSYHSINREYTTLKHVHFKGISTFQHGLNIQKLITDNFLNYKTLETKIRRLQRRNELNDLSILRKFQSLKPCPIILTFEFNNVYAGGLRSKNEISLIDIENFKKLGSEYYQLDRGGQLTWHGNGQLVSYLILDLKNFEKLSTKCFVNNVLLKSAQILFDENYNLKTNIQSENPGLWINDNNNNQDFKKIASVGIRVRHGITDFGISLNINPDLKFLNTFEMCGLKNKKQTSINQQLGINPTIDEVANLYVKQIGKALEVDKIISITSDEL